MAQQQEIPGTERLKIKEIDKAAEDYVNARDARMRLTEKEVACKSVLIQVMEKHKAKLSENGNGEKIYRYDDQIVVLSEVEKVKVRTAVEETEPD